MTCGAHFGGGGGIPVEIGVKIGSIFGSQGMPRGHLAYQSDH